MEISKLHGTNKCTTIFLMFLLQQSDEKTEYHFMGFPVEQLDDPDSLLAVFEFGKKEDGSKEGFTNNDVEVVGSYLAWGKIALSHGEICSNSWRQKELQEFLLTVVK